MIPGYLDILETWDQYPETISRAGNGALKMYPIFYHKISAGWCMEWTGLSPLGPKDSLARYL